MIAERGGQSRANRDGGDGGTDKPPLAVRRMFCSLKFDSPQKEPLPAMGVSVRSSFSIYEQPQ
jgi:hypothetical protein